jgi:hypothetical protein
MVVIGYWFNVCTRTMTADNLEAMSEINAATAPRKNVGAIACEKIWVKRSASGIKSNILGSTYRESTRSPSGSAARDLLN